MSERARVTSQGWRSASLGWALLAGAAPAVGCTSRARSVLSPASPAADVLAELGWPILIACTVVSAVMTLLIFWLATRRTGTLAEHAPVMARGGMTWVWMGGIVIPGIAFTAVYVATVGSLAAFPSQHDADAPPADIRVTGRQWWWEVEYQMGPVPQHFRTANEIHLPTDRPIEIELASADVIHSFWVPRLHGKVDLVPGRTNHIRLSTPVAGVYDGECAEFCGLQHARMRFQVVVEAPSIFAAWLAQQRRPAAVPRDPQAVRGAGVFLGAACPMCHTIAGTGALATVGPDLTHVAGRQMIAAGWLPRDVATMHAWIVNAPSLKPGVQMPVLSQLTGGQLHDLVAYLEELQ
jgi:cytochrome c oxidase subunit 2